MQVGNQHLFFYTQLSSPKWTRTPLAFLQMQPQFICPRYLNSSTWGLHIHNTVVLNHYFNINTREQGLLHIFCFLGGSACPLLIAAQQLNSNFFYQSSVLEPNIQPKLQYDSFLQSSLTSVCEYAHEKSVMIIITIIITSYDSGCHDFRIPQVISKVVHPIQRVFRLDIQQVLFGFLNLPIPAIVTGGFALLPCLVRLPLYVKAH